MSTNEELIGREDINDLEAILGITNTNVDELVHAVKDNAAAIFTWDYEKGARPALNRLYEKAKTSQWNGETDLPWETDVDQEAVVANNAMASGGFDAGIDIGAHKGSRSDCRHSHRVENLFHQTTPVRIVKGNYRHRTQSYKEPLIYSEVPCGTGMCRALRIPGWNYSELP